MTILETKEADASAGEALGSDVDLTPLVVDVDGTLVVTDLLQEAALQLVATAPLQAFLIPVWLARGKSNLKTHLADRVDPGVDSVPLREPVVAMIRKAQACGRPVWLASASDHRYVERLAQRIGGVAGVFGTEPGGRNLAGEAKAERLVAAFGAAGFDYVGDQPVDFAVWRSARRVLAVAHSRGFAARVKAAFPQAQIVDAARPDARGYLKALRLHQWAKNALLFLPMIAGHRFDATTIVSTVLAFFCFCFAASSAYVINDLLDLPGDRDHPRKSRRPFAAGVVPIPHGAALSALLMTAAFALSSLLPARFTLVLGLYVATTLGYSLYLKRKVLIDVVVLGWLYTVRVYGGLAAINAHQTQWLLMFSLFLFLSLAIVKRCTELVAKRAAGKTAVIGRGYRVEDLAVLLPIGAAAGYGAVFVVTLYLSSPEVVALYRHASRLWLICPPLIYWISRVLVLANRGELHDDPVVFALTDRTSWVTGLVAAAAIAVSI
jgi:4-hydroxybenzoate polyprenyltransferase/phosphoserine phosphatase